MIFWFFAWNLYQKTKIASHPIFSIEKSTFHNNNPQILTYVFKCDLRQILVLNAFLKYKSLMTKLQIAITWNLFFQMYTHVDVEYAPPKRLNQWEGKEKQMPDWGPINDSKSGTYLRTYTSQQLLNGFPIQLEIKLKLRKVKLTIGKRGRPRNYRVGLRLDSQVLLHTYLQTYLPHTIQTVILPD